MKKNKFTDKLLVHMIPLRETFGFYVAGVPIRIGELYSAFYGGYCLLHGQSKIKNKHLISLIALLILNLIVTLTSSIVYFNSIDTGFFYKYLLRNALNLFFIFAFVLSEKSISDDCIKKLFPYTVYIEFFMFIFLYTTGHGIIMNSVFLPIQFVNIGSITLPRFFGTGMEPGYLVPVLIMPIYYYLQLYRHEKKGKRQLILCTVMVIFTFSTFMYAVYVLTIFITFFNFKSMSRKRVVTTILGLAVCIVTVVVGWNIIKSTNVGTVVMYHVDKALGYITGNRLGQRDWSANDRSQHLANAWNWFKCGNLFEIFFGHGTGGYSHYAAYQSSGLLVSDVNEAYNLYLSTLTDRGIIGLFCMIGFFYAMYRYKSDNLISNAIFWGISVQYIQYLLVGNMWLYFLWQEIVLLIGYERFLRKQVRISENINSGK